MGATPRALPVAVLLAAVTAPVAADDPAPRTELIGETTLPHAMRADPRGATDVQHVDSLADAEVRPVRKRLLADLSEFDSSAVNIEGMIWGPRPPDAGAGHRRRLQRRADHPADHAGRWLRPFSLVG